MSVKIYKEINNNTLTKRDNNILLRFICEVNLWNADNIFDCCLHYDENEEEYYEVAETYNSALEMAVKKLKSLIDNESNTDGSWYIEATRCFDILVNAMNECEGHEFFMIFVC